MTPVLVLFSLSIWILLWGPVGGLLAIPLTVSLRIVFDSLNEANIGQPYTATASALLAGSTVEAAVQKSVSRAEALASVKTA